MPSGPNPASYFPTLEKRYGEPSRYETCDDYRASRDETKATTIREIWCVN